MFSFNPTSKQWLMIKIIGKIPEPRNSMSLFGFQKKLYVFGGFAGTSTIFYDFHVLNLKTKHWE